MDLDGAIARYLSNPDVARWLFSREDIKSVPAKALDASFVYAIGFGAYDPKTPRAMNIEDMLIVTGQVGSFVLGVIWGLAQPHVFARTPLMLDKIPASRRFAVDFSARDALEFMEFVSFDDGKVIVMFRQFLHTNDLSLPVVGCARLHSASKVEQTLGPILMRADLLEAPCCPRCGLVGRKCLCSFGSYAPAGNVRKVTHTWNQFTSRFMHKARVGTIKLQMTAVLPNVGEMRIVDDDLACVNVMQRGDTEYMSLLRRKAVHGLGINVIIPRSESLVLSKSLEHDFLDLHNGYIARKRERDHDELPTIPLLPPTEPLDLTATQGLLDSSPPGGPTYSDSIDSVDDVLTIFPGIFDVGESPRIPDDIADPESSPVDKSHPLSLPQIPEDFDPFLKVEPIVTASTTQEGGVMSRKETAPPTDVSTLGIVDDIELILSPPGSQGETAPEVVMPPSDVVDNVLKKPAIQFSSSISSEHGSRDVQEERGTREAPAKRKRTTAKRAKPSPQSTADSGPDSEKKHACTACSSRFKMRGDLLRHIKIVHEGKKMHTCKTCGKAFGHSGHLNRHISSVHLQERRFKCQFCGFQFFQQSHLQSHIGHIHGATKSFACKECGYRASNRNELKAHVNAEHTGPKTAGVQCPYAGCLLTFANETDLAMHTVMTHRQAPFSLSAEAQITPLPR